MAAIESRASRRPNRFNVPDPAYWIWKQMTSVKIAIAQSCGHRKTVLRPDCFQQITPRSGRHIQKVDCFACLMYRFYCALQKALDVDLACADPIPARRVEIDSINQSTKKRRAFCFVSVHVI